MNFFDSSGANSYQRLQMEAFDGKSTLPKSSPAPAKAKPEAPPPPPVVEPEPSPSITTWPTADELDALHQQAHAEGFTSGHAEGLAQGKEQGYQEGFAAGKAEALANMEPQIGLFTAMILELDQSLNQFDQEIGEEVCQLAIEVARQMVRHTLAVRPDSVLDVVRDALAQLPQGHAQIHLNPEDAQLANEAIGEQMHQLGHRIIENPSVTRGGCKIEAGNTQIDASVETRWRRILSTLGRKTDWNTGEQHDSSN